MCDICLLVVTEQAGDIIHKRAISKAENKRRKMKKEVILIFLFLIISTLSANKLKQKEKVQSNYLYFKRILTEIDSERKHILNPLCHLDSLQIFTEELKIAMQNIEKLKKEISEQLTSHYAKFNRI